MFVGVGEADEVEDEAVDYFVGEGVFLVEQDADEEGVGAWVVVVRWWMVNGGRRAEELVWNRRGVRAYRCSPYSRYAEVRRRSAIAVL